MWIIIQIHLYIYICMLHNATRVGRNPMLRAYMFTAYMLTCLYACMLICLHAYVFACLRVYMLAWLLASRSLLGWPQREEKYVPIHFQNAFGFTKTPPPFWWYLSCPSGLFNGQNKAGILAAINSQQNRNQNRSPKYRPSVYNIT